MNFGFTYRTIWEANGGNAFQFSPTPATVPFAKQRSYTNRGAGCNSLNLGNLAKDLEVHWERIGAGANLAFYFFFANSSFELNFGNDGKFATRRPISIAKSAS